MACCHLGDAVCFEGWVLQERVGLMLVLVRCGVVPPTDCVGLCPVAVMCGRTCMKRVFGVAGPCRPTQWMYYIAWRSFPCLCACSLTLESMLPLPCCFVVL
jgi:hypothetical protein